MKTENAIEEKSFEFAVRIINLYKHLIKEKKECILSKQLLRSGTSIGANISEAQKAQSESDFVAKFYIALKEANESYYWLRLLHRTEYLSDKEFKSLDQDIDEIMALLTTIIKTIKEKKKTN